MAVIKLEAPVHKSAAVVSVNVRVLFIAHADIDHGRVSGIRLINLDTVFGRHPDFIQQVHA